jgi:hypothetical protein
MVARWLVAAGAPVLAVASVFVAAPAAAGAAAPEPSPSYSNDPFAPDVSIWPEAPSWLFPAVMTLLGIAGMVMVVLLYMWFKSVQMSKAEREALPKQEWVDLSKLDKGGRWRDEADQPPAHRNDGTES